MRPDTSVLLPMHRLLTGLTLFFVISAVIGGVRWYTPIPFSDMWEGYIGFYDRVMAGDDAIWLAPHNEHRILWARILFWMDLQWFQGKSIFLFIVNYLLVGAAITVFYRYLRLYDRDVNLSVSGRHFLFCLTVMLLMSWVQAGNLAWAFQSQFFLAQTLPLLAFYLMQRAIVQGSDSWRSFWSACLIGVAALGAMANGVLTLPLLFVQCVIARQGSKRCAWLLLLAVLMPYLYFRGFTRIGSHGSLSQALISNPFGFLSHFLSYLGGPWYRYAGTGQFGLVVAKIAGFGVLAATALAGVRLIFRRDWQSPDLGLLLFIVYITGTAAGTAAGRLNLGVDPALVSRYTTPALMAWVALLLLYRQYLPKFGDLSNRRKRVIAAAWLIFILLLSNFQIRALRSKVDDHFQMQVALLALVLGIKDSDQISKVGMPMDRVMLQADRAAAHGWSIWGQPPWHGLKAQIGQAVVLPEASHQPGCRVAEASLHALPLASEYLLIEGKIQRISATNTPAMTMSVNDGQGIMSGYALLKRVLPVSQDKTGYPEYLFKGYVRALSAMKTLDVVWDDAKCQLNFNEAILGGR